MNDLIKALDDALKIKCENATVISKIKEYDRKYADANLVRNTFLSKRILDDFRELYEYIYGLSDDSLYAKHDRLDMEQLFAMLDILPEQTVLIAGKREHVILQS